MGDISDFDFKFELNDKPIIWIKVDTTREVIGIYNVPTESASVCQDIFKDLKLRGLQNTDLLVIDDLSGLDCAIE